MTKRDYSFLWAFLVITAVCLIAFLAVQVNAQDATPTPAPVSDLTDTLLTDIELFLGTYGGIIGIAASFLVGVIGGIPALANVPKRVINLVVSGVLVVGLLLATNFGYGTQYQGALDAIPVIGKALLALLVAFGFSTGVHEAASVYSVPVWGSKRTPKA